MYHLCQKDQGRFAEVEQLLPLEVALATLAGDGRDEGRQMRRRGGSFVPDELPGVLDIGVGQGRRLRARAGCHSGS